MKEGDKNSALPQPGQKASILYKCRLSNFHTVVDSSENDKDPFHFVVDSDGIIKGLNMGVKTMHKGERAVFKIPPEFAYGSKGVGPIPSNETLYFEAELLNCHK